METDSLIGIAICLGVLALVGIGFELNKIAAILRKGH